jgi:hypothetical protein
VDISNGPEDCYADPKEISLIQRSIEVVFKRIIAPKLFHDRDGPLLSYNLSIDLRSRKGVGGALTSLQRKILMFKLEVVFMIWVEEDNLKCPI